MDINGNTLRWCNNLKGFIPYRYVKQITKNK